MPSKSAPARKALLSHDMIAIGPVADRLRDRRRPGARSRPVQPLPDRR
jgi:hypothetical protein